MFGFSREGIIYQLDMTQFLQATLSLPRRLGHGLRGQGRTGRLASFCLLAVPIALPGFYIDGAEGPLKRRYRLEPGQAVRSRYHAGAADMLAALQRGRRTGVPADLLLTGNVLAKQLLN
jgi:hypothetical protein